MLDRELKNATNILTALSTSHFLQVGDLKSFHEHASEVARRLDIRIVLRDANTRGQLLNTATPWGMPISVIDRSSDILRLTNEDNGPGFDPAARRAGSRVAGLGIGGMRERLALLGGSLEIESAVGRGTTIYARIPIEAERMIA
jgi:signal transduction histidine kinase